MHSVPRCSAHPDQLPMPSQPQQQHTRVLSFNVNGLRALLRDRLKLTLSQFLISLNAGMSVRHGSWWGRSLRQKVAMPCFLQTSFACKRPSCGGATSTGTWR